MTVLIRVPTLLRPLVGGSPAVEAEGATVAEVIAAVDTVHPGFADAVLEQDGTIRRFVTVFVGDDDVRYLQGPGTAVPVGSEMVILPAVAGGALLAPPAARYPCRR